jgi:hypothetical protein|tara:strand:+ start:3270 stop:3542 length:273 start_codon:yes stop_codon:yes gene_type:complete
MDYKYVMEMLEKARSEGDTDKVQELESILSTMEPLDSDDNDIQKFKDGGFPDLTGDGKVTQKDILRGRGVKGFSQGGGIAVTGTKYRGTF